jgi:signal transduction histidine kinase
MDSVNKTHLQQIIQQTQTIAQAISSGQPWEQVLPPISDRSICPEILQLSESLQALLHTVAEQSRSHLKAAQELQEAKDLAEAGSRAKSQFLANMSHELRTPMNAILGYSEMLMEDALEASNLGWHRDLGRINTAGQHLLGLINDILDLSKIEAGKMELYLEQFDLQEMIDEVVVTIQPLLNKYGNHLVVHRDPALTTIFSDLTKVRQILFNLLSNATKFTDRGTIILTLEYETQTKDLCIRLADTGTGMTPEQMENLFEAFSQADSALPVISVR